MSPLRCNPPKNTLTLHCNCAHLVRLHCSSIPHFSTPHSAPPGVEVPPTSDRTAMPRSLLPIPFSPPVIRSSIFVSMSLVLSFLLLTTITASADSAGHRPRTHPSKPSNLNSHPHRTDLYTRSAAPSGWSVGPLASPSSPLSFTVIVEGSSMDELCDLFWQVSDPDSLSYGHFLTNAEIESLVSPSSSELQVLYNSLSFHGIDRSAVVSHGDSFDVTTTVGAASSLFNTQFHEFTHTKTGWKAISQMGSSSLPSDIASQVKVVLGVHTFPTIEQRLQMSAQRRSRASAVRRAMADSGAALTSIWVPKAVASIYGVPYPIAPLSTPEISAGPIEWTSEVFSPSDLTRFSTDVGVPLAPVDQHHIVGNNSETPYPGTEAELDIQWIEGINPGFTPWFWLVSDPTKWMYTFTVEFLQATDYPSIISLSYGLPETLQCRDTQDCPSGVDYVQYIQMVNRQFQKIGLIGTSILVSSGDSGTYGFDSSFSPVFTPEYPGTSPFITAVGGTEYSNPVFNLPSPPPVCTSVNWQCISGGADEQAASDASFYKSGGGFSTISSTPAYQSAAVNGYFNSGVTLPNQTLWNRTGRGSPDVSAIGMSGYFVNRQEGLYASGTSLSSPIFAAVMALVAADYYAITNSTLGFLNTLLYKGQGSGAGLFKDIVLGNNCQTPKCTVQDGFSTAKGWDPVTGLGTPVYPAMKTYVQKLGEKVVARRTAATAAAGDSS